MAERKYQFERLTPTGNVDLDIYKVQAAMQEARNIRNGDISAKIYSSACKLLAELDAEMDGE